MSDLRRTRLNEKSIDLDATLIRSANAGAVSDKYREQWPVSQLASSQKSRSTLKLSDNRVLSALLSEILGRRVIVIREGTDR